jgi:hypothetical protein
MNTECWTINWQYLILKCFSNTGIQTPTLPPELVDLQERNWAISSQNTAKFSQKNQPSSYILFLFSTGCLLMQLSKRPFMLLDITRRIRYTVMCIVSRCIHMCIDRPNSCLTHQVLTCTVVARNYFFILPKPRQNGLVSRKIKKR